MTDLDAYQVRMTSLCAQWQLHRHATAYRVVLESLVGKLLNRLIYIFSPTQRTELHELRNCMWSDLQTGSGKTGNDGQKEELSTH